jgi:nicotinic acid phosphoribosyltransferase
MSGDTIKIDGQDYAVSALSDEAKAQVQNLRFTDQELARLQAQLAIAQTARISYAKALKAELDKTKPADAGH